MVSETQKVDVPGYPFDINFQLIQQLELMTALIPLEMTQIALPIQIFKISITGQDWRENKKNVQESQDQYSQSDEHLKNTFLKNKFYIERGHFTLLTFYEFIK